jgi:hypothetical protein
MAGNHNPNNLPCKRMHDMQAQLNCTQINLQHSRLATNNLMKIIEEDSMDILCIQELYTICNKIVGLSKQYKTFTSGEGRIQAAIVMNNKLVGTILIKQLSDKDLVVIEVTINNDRIILASMYFDINRPIHVDMLKIEAIILHTKEASVLIAMDSNSRSTSWHDTLTNRRGRMLEEYLMSKQLHIMNEDGNLTTFQNSRGTSNIDITVINNQLLSTIVEWEISDQESCSDHGLIRYVIGHSLAQMSVLKARDMMYKVTNYDIAKFQRNLTRLAEQKFCEKNKEGGIEALDKTLCTCVMEESNIEKSVEEFHEVMESACGGTFRRKRATKKALTHKTVPWWIQELTIIRKSLNAQRHRYQRTRDSKKLWEQRRSLYLDVKARSAATIKNAKITVLQHCGRN